MLRLSKKGRSSNTKRSAVGIPTATTASMEPGTSFNNWKNGRKYHSGRGTYVVSLGSAGSSSPAPEKYASSASTTMTMAEVTRSFAMMSGQKRTTAFLERL